MRLVVATRNRHKVREIVALLAEEGWAMDALTLDEVAPKAELLENEDTFEGNALAKARQASIACDMPAIADDSGLEVDALNGAPGVRSARWAGEPCDDGRNNAKLLREMAAVPDGTRIARYRCAAAFVNVVQKLEVVRSGACEGVLLAEARGTGGFGYDPLFFIPSLGRTMAEIDLVEKNRLSHRAAAFRALARALREGAEKK